MALNDLSVVAEDDGMVTYVRYSVGEQDGV
jgi:hypothetical protein